MEQSKAKRAKKPVMIMDGGMGRELERMGAPFRQPEWSALALMQAPQSVSQAYDNFIKAGAEIIITNAYAVVPFHVGQAVFDTQGRDLIRIAATRARDCADKAPHKVTVAASIPPLFGSYNPDAFCEDKALAILMPLIEEQADHIDVWLMETISSLKEGEFVARELAKTGKPLWASFTLTDREDKNDPPTIRSENTVEKAVKATLTWANIEGILFNCSRPEEMADALSIAATLIPDTIHLGAYANNFKKSMKKGHLANEQITPLNDELTPQDYYDFAVEWRTLGSNIIGGCCGIGPHYIQYLKENLS